MKKKSKEITPPYLPKLWAIVIYFILFIGVMFLFWGRTNQSVRSSFLLDYLPNYHTHISNFCISFMLCLGSSFLNIMFTKSLKYPAIIGSLLIAANFIYEAAIPILNTPDLNDAYYGLVGTLLPFIYFYFYKNFGLLPNPNYKQIE